MAYSTADLILDVDSIAKIQDLLEAVLGDGSGSTSVSARAKDTLERVMAYEDWPIASAMGSPAWEFYNRALTVPEDGVYQALSGVVGRPFWTCLRGLLGDIKTGMVARGVRMHPEAAANYLAALSSVPDPSIVFPLVTDMGQSTRAGGTFTFVDDQAIDGAVYSGALLEMKMDVLIGGVDIGVTLTVIASVGADPVEIGPITIPSGTAQGVVIACGSGEWLDVTGIVCTGGTDADQFTVQSIQERDPLA